MDDEDYGVFYGFGSVHDLRDGEGSTPRLLGMRSVSNRAAWALHREPKSPKSRRIGFALPKANRR